MSIVLGFGCLEEQERQRIKQAVIDGASCGKSISDVLEKWNTAAKTYDAMPRETAPERYTSAYYYEVALHYNHINRRHPFSPDGWACLSVTEPIVVVREDR
jgi:hypothetical protein